MQVQSAKSDARSCGNEISAEQRFFRDQPFDGVRIDRAPCATNHDFATNLRYVPSGKQYSNYSSSIPAAGRYLHYNLAAEL